MDGFVMAEKSNTNEDAAQTALMCQFCDQQNIKWKCVDCDILLCSSCKEKIHKKLKSADKHKILSIQDIGKNTSTAKRVNSNIVTVTITHLVLSTGAAVLDKESISQLFVSYIFLGIELHELETPFSLPKPKAEQPINFNYSKTFHVDMAKNYPKRKYLAGMLLPDDPDGGRIRFTVVSEPLEDDDDGECEDIGIAFVSVRDILMNHNDVIDHDIPIFDAKNEKEKIGALNVTVQCLSALEAIEKEMQIDGTF
ncbi:X-linked retinitis pigmentosa GTPase regulator-interacting protein 1-like [Mytilus edulis]|uniref:X-linked retinitis pigmentosa GTPase regulator-interacting protein 1-like n=1 Tax=Mytilus edulis TaxID=6550 RepID=UPI0039EE0B2D